MKGHPNHMTDESKAAGSRTAHPAPSTGAFLILLVTLWALNLADIFQTLYLKEVGLLASEANIFIDFFLKGGRGYFFLAKLLALVLISLILVRGWLDRGGIKMYGTTFSQADVRKAIHFLLSAGVVYYTVIVIFPFIAMLLSGFFTSE